MVLGAAVSIGQAHRANEAAERATVVKDFVIDAFRINAHHNPSNAELRQLPVELLLERGARLIDTKFASQPSLQAELQGVVGGIFLDMASYELAAQSARKEIQALHSAGATRAELATATTRLSRALSRQDKLAQAEADAVPRSH